jgi:regulator of replication initiation timing
MTQKTKDVSMTKTTKTKRVRQVYPSGQVIHLWANQSQTSARSSNVFYQDNRIYSYGMHYLAGQLHKVNGKTIAVVNTQRYSNTTAKHLAWIRGATRHLPTVFGSDPSNLKLAIQETQDQLLTELMDQFNRRKFWFYGSTNSSFYGRRDNEYCIVNQVLRFNEACKASGFSKYILPIDQDFVSLLNSHARLQFEKEKEKERLKNTPEAIAKREALAEKAREEARLKAQDDLKAWLDGSAAYATASVRALEPQYIRIKGDEVETSRGASVPLSHAMRLLMKILNNSFSPSEKVGHFKLDEVNKDQIRIGCHKLSLEQVKSVLMNRNVESKGA